MRFSLSLKKVELSAAAAGQIDSWQDDLTPHKLSHANLWAYLTQGLTLLGNLCGLSAIIKDFAAALAQVGHASI